MKEKVSKSEEKTVVIVPVTNQGCGAPSVVPYRFNSTSHATRTSIVRPELNSVTEVKFSGFILSAHLR